MQPNVFGGFDFEYAGGLLEVFRNTTTLAAIPVEAFTVSTTAETNPQNEGFWEPELLVAGTVNLRLTLGPGVLDPALAALLGVSHITSAGEFMNVIVDDPILVTSSDECRSKLPALPDASYCGVWNDISAQIEVEEVPEPAAVILFGLGVGISFPVLRRARRMRTRS